MPILQRLPVCGLFLALAASVALAAGQGASPNQAQAKRPDPKRPRLQLRVQPPTGIAPLRAVFTGELIGGDDDFEEYYCPTIEWEWGDDTSSESTVDCPPYEPGKSQIKRRFTVEHIFRREGNYTVYIHLKRKDRELMSASTNVQVQAGFQP